MPLSRPEPNDFQLQYNESDLPLRRSSTKTEPSSHRAERCPRSSRVPGALSEHSPWPRPKGWTRGAGGREGGRAAMPDPRGSDRGLPVRLRTVDLDGNGDAGPGHGLFGPPRGLRPSCSRAGLASLAVSCVSVLLLLQNIL